MSANNYILKICVVGDGSVGKTSMVLRYSEKKFQERYIMTIGSNFALKKLIMADGTNVKLQIWDLAGQQHFNFVRPPFYRGASGIIYVFDLTRRQSFDNLLNWQKEVESVIKKPFLLVGNKVDLKDERIISTEEANLLSENMGSLQYLETSAKTGVNLDDSFHLLVGKILYAEKTSQM